MTGGTHISVLPGQAPTTNIEKGEDLGLRNVVDTIDGTNREFENNKNISVLTTYADVEAI